MLTSVNTPAVITLDEEGRIKLRFTTLATAIWRL